MSVVPFSNHCLSLLIASDSFEDLGIAVSKTHIMDWWDSKRFKVSVAGKDNQPSAVNITCTPVMSWVHRALLDSVRLFRGIKAKRAVGMHWATWVSTGKDVLEPPNHLAEECKKLVIDDDTFTE
ncbi:uncharacterized protein LACBIDRAFT_317918 [Laccaria bicolor S238N-H82]|uniref:Predicted protein n=1 Tax=Laccaria bicolor (strain S238N-H82 / ATCC MYA-4686) TaxID=486041 RepID=B0D5I4_LACBS|nr:uncharacterized protein LACBIDRAFT_317918 [Laccaria bicolor S238N-H82]EDR10027.1 predicted protein [Laccaria bicolor S238N-H82]|eukprot:XP_001879412.1 predicted protein [Laccaria bicolor S238N-H82]